MSIVPAGSATVRVFDLGFSDAFFKCHQRCGGGTAVQFGIGGGLWRLG